LPDIGILHRATELKSGAFEVEEKREEIIITT